MESLIFTAAVLIAFGLASIAAQSWRELGVLLVLTAVLYWPAKWLLAGTSLGGDSLTIEREPWKISFSPSFSVFVAIAIAAAIMILARHFRLARQAKSDSAA